MNESATPLHRTQDLGPSGTWIDTPMGSGVDFADLPTRHPLDASAVEDVLDVEQLPKFDDTEHHLFVVLHGLTHDGDRLDTIEVDCFVSESELITIHHEASGGLDWLWSSVERHPQLSDDGPPEVFGHLCEAIGRRFLAVADELEARVDLLGDDALAAAPNILGEIQLLRREEATIRKMLTPQLRILQQLARLDTPHLNDGARPQLVDAFDVHSQVVASLATSRQLLADTLDTYRGAVAERQGRAANLLTVYAAIVLPMTLIAGWYGMNTENLPAAGRPWGWIVVSGVMLVVGLVSWLYFARIGLVRQPRLVEPIGKGLSVAARAPMRPVTMLRRDQLR